MNSFETVQEQVEAMRRLVRSSAALLHGVNTVDIDLDENYRPFVKKSHERSSSQRSLSSDSGDELAGRIHNGLFGPGGTG